jgi:5-methylcytosine-specific restriction endonuclease McrA
MTLKHIHHIVPKHMGGSDDPSNLVELTVEEHAEAHRKLYEQYGHWEDNCAYLALSGQIGQDEAMFIARSKGGKKPMSEESKAKLRASCKLRTERQRANGILEKANKQRSKTQKGYKKSAEHMENWKKARRENLAKKKALIA